MCEPLMHVRHDNVVCTLITFARMLHWAATSSPPLLRAAVTTTRLSGSTDTLLSVYGLRKTAHSCPNLCCCDLNLENHSQRRAQVRLHTRLASVEDSPVSTEAVSLRTAC